MRPRSGASGNGGPYQIVNPIRVRRKHGNQRCVCACHRYPNSAPRTILSRKSAVCHEPCQCALGCIRMRFIEDEPPFYMRFVCTGSGGVVEKVGNLLVDGAFEAGHRHGRSTPRPGFKFGDLFLEECFFSFERAQSDAGINNGKVLIRRSVGEVQRPSSGVRFGAAGLLRVHRDQRFANHTRP